MDAGETTDRAMGLNREVSVECNAMAEEQPKQQSMHALQYASPNTPVGFDWAGWIVTASIGFGILATLGVLIWIISLG